LVTVSARLRLLIKYKLITPIYDFHKFKIVAFSIFANSHDAPPLSPPSHNRRTIVVIILWSIGCYKSLLINTLSTRLLHTYIIWGLCGLLLFRRTIEININSSNLAVTAHAVISSVALIVVPSGYCWSNTTI